MGQALDFVIRCRAWRGLSVLLTFLLAALAIAVPHTFGYTAPAGTKSVNIAGTFNGWNKDATPLRAGGDGRTWSVTLELEPGRIQYKFVLDGGTWVTDPSTKSESDGNGNTNSVLWILPDGYDRPAAKGDGEIAVSALKHETDEPDLNYDRGQLQISLRARPNDIEHVRLHVRGGADLEMRQVGEDEIFARYRAETPWDRSRTIAYDFFLVDGSKTLYFGPRGVTESPEGNLFILDRATYKPLIVPSWVEHSVIYQIFPDRFANGDKSNDPPNVKPWDGPLDYGTWLGGDFAGIQQHLNYLEVLGISCIYFNPIFQSPVYHRYETSDFHAVARELGTNAQFDDLTKTLNSKGIRTVLDGVFNHTATDFMPFADVVKNGAASQYKEWYTFKGFPVKLGRDHNYVAWNDYPSMPKLNHSNPQVQDYVWGVPKFWDSQAAIAGWRLDAANEVPDAFWQGFRRAVKAVNPEDWIVGEVWGDASHWLKGDMWDSVMNYPFLFATTGFVGADGDGKPSSFMRKVMANYANYAPQVSRNLMNLIDSHDTPRILNACGGNRKLADLAAILEFAWVGAPTLYYGDEIGMAGGRDPDDRRGMTWEAVTESNPTLKLYRSLISARRKSLELQSGDPVALLADDDADTLAFGRTINGRAAICVVNRANAQRGVHVSLTAVAPKMRALYDALTGKPVRIEPDGTVSLVLEAQSGTILIPERP
ncbi:MAG TPA: alpha amylase N-terminal ig-like domain-containing protein [Fimbriimonadaceae bacterium]|nr:alpha amylase N-terminal ig-like domain-containing protein [Fimbriimonadaceae bacterium]